MNNRTIKLDLRHTFSDKEINTLGRELGATLQRVEKLEEEKAELSADFTAKIKREKLDLHDTSRKIQNGYELREIECQIRYNEPEVGKKTTIRTDTVKTVRVEAMTEAEKQEELKLAEVE